MMQGLFKITNYELLREIINEDGSIKGCSVLRIRAKKCLSNPGAKFFAVPEKDLLGELRQAMNEFVGEGDSEEEAINNCIDKIGERSFTEIFKSPE